MPIYAYRCEACGFAKDVLQSISAAPLTDCEACGKPEFRKQVTAAQFQLKGSGWYVTDFRNGAKPAAKSDTGTAESATSAGASASTSTEPAAAATPAPSAPPAAATSAASSGAATTPPAS